VKNFRIIEFEKGIKANIYAVCLDNSLESEFDKFLETCPVEYEIDLIADTINNIKDAYGIRRKYFKYEAGDSIYRFVTENDLKSKVRVYCIKWSNGLLILGGGEIKDFSLPDNAWQEHPELRRIIEPLVNIEKYLTENNIAIEDAVSNNLIFEAGL